MNPVKRPGTAHSFVTEFEGSGQINPNPGTGKDSDLLFDIYLSPEKLRNLSGSDDLQQVTSLEMCVDTQQTILGDIVLLAFMAIRSQFFIFSNHFILVRELYVAYNNVSDLSQVCMLEQLELVDLEGNDVDDLVQVQYLGLCGKLKTLTLEGNPICTCPHPGAPQSVKIPFDPHLQYSSAEDEEPRYSSAMMEDWVLLKESIRDTSAITDGVSDCLDLMELGGASVCDLLRPRSAQHPGTSVGYSSPLSRPGTARPLSSSISSRPSSADSVADIPNFEASDLTHGVGRVLFCGNPLHAIRARRQKIKLQGQSSHSTPCTQLGSYIPEHTYDVEETSSQDYTDVFAELRAWRKEHNKRLLAIERNRQPQVMKIMHGDDNG
ncbi:hypothetical protein QTP86_003310 [Hemibagrus guttatus]|nr:hypothetical protein QTP86_003310 [Hemibagrus guttatus]